MHKMRKTLTLSILTLILAVALVACGGSKGEDLPDADLVLTQAAEIASAGLTQTAEVLNDSAGQGPSPTVTLIMPTAATPTPTITSTAGEFPTAAAGTPDSATPTPTTTPVPSSGGDTGLPCLRAYLDYEKYPDGSQFPAGSNFTQEWRLKNTGSCKWTSGFQVYWVEGDKMDAELEFQLTDQDVYTYGHATVSIDFTAPVTPGTYRGYWMLRSADGEVFGVGPNGQSWLWVDIESVP
jgi:hypothetical protein